MHKHIQIQKHKSIKQDNIYQFFHKKKIFRILLVIFQATPNAIPLAIIQVLAFIIFIFSQKKKKTKAVKILLFIVQKKNLLM